MKKILIWVLFLIFAISLWAQDDAGPVNMGGGVGSVIIGDHAYMRLRLNPELTLGKFGLGLDIDLLIDADGNVRKEDWDDFSDYVNKIYYIRYGSRGDNFYGKLGSFNSYSLAHGLIMNDYCNTLNYPMERQLGLMLGIGLPMMNMQIEAFTSNITDPTIFAGRLTLEPFDNSSIPIVNNIQLGTTLGYDVNQYEGLTKDERKEIRIDTDGDGIWDRDDYDPDGDGKITEEAYNQLLEEGLPEEWIQVQEFDPFEDVDELSFNKSEMVIWGVDYEVPLIKTDMLILSHYAEFSQIVNHNYGIIFPGFYAKFFIFHLNLEFRQYEDDYLAGYFDHYYDQDRASAVFVPSIGNYEVVLKEERLANAMASTGWFGKLRADIFDFLYLEAGYTDMYGKDNEDGVKSLTGVAGINTKIIPKLKNMEFKYYQLDVPKIKDFVAPHVIVQGTIRYELSPGTNLVWDYQERYIDVNGDGKIKGSEETTRSVSAGVEFQF
ncbi:MAG: hypothetical protein K9N06_03920 [Candidatus Cloacimonetes bacterium]|nr:hypothetical protein [Candidatus Cloacimonadota bacterium]